MTTYYITAAVNNEDARAICEDINIDLAERSDERSLFEAALEDYRDVRGHDLVRLYGLTVAER